VITDLQPAITLAQVGQIFFDQVKSSSTYATVLTLLRKCHKITFDNLSSRDPPFNKFSVFWEGSQFWWYLLSNTSTLIQDHFHEWIIRIFVTTVFTYVQIIDLVSAKGSDRIKNLATGTNAQRQHLSAVKIANYVVPHLPKMVDCAVMCSRICQTLQYMCGGLNEIVQSIVW
jgi:hypothetical protein